MDNGIIRVIATVTHRLKTHRDNDCLHNDSRRLLQTVISNHGLCSIVFGVLCILFFFHTPSSFIRVILFSFSMFIVFSRFGSRHIWHFLVSEVQTILHPVHTLYRTYRVLPTHVLSGSV